MKRKLASIAVVVLLVVVDVLATCGGGGGGGTGGMGGGSGAMAEVVYQVPWKALRGGETLDAGGLVLYWFPASPNELKNSSLRNSRALSVYASQCVTMGVADIGEALGHQFAVDEKAPVAVLAQSDGKIIGKAQGGPDGKLRVEQVEKLLEGEIKQREAGLKQSISAAKDAAKRGEKEAAIAQFRSVVDQKCLFPKQAKDAANELKKLGVAGVAPVPDAPNFDPAIGAQAEQALKTGLMAENMADYQKAEKFYSAANRLDPADPAPLRYLGELYRHQTGDWVKARATFRKILDMPADPLSRAVALHGIGKMTIHDGEFLAGLHLMEQSADVFPLPLTYRNLAVYWHSEGDRAKADEYTRKALALDPDEPFNVVFAAAFAAGEGGERGRQALGVAQAHEDLLCASYNLAAIHAQLGDRNKALALLKRHFYDYETNDAVRSKEMMEARVDAVFASIVKDPEFLTLTPGADGKLPLPRKRHRWLRPPTRCSLPFPAPTAVSSAASRWTSSRPAAAASSASSTSRGSAGRPT
jgi:tetratricopeptide (TPR) repeat protein